MIWLKAMLVALAATSVDAENVYPDAIGLHRGWSENAGWISFSHANTSSCAKVDFGLQFDPAALAPAEPMIFADGLED